MEVLTVFFCFLLPGAPGHRHAMPAPTCLKAGPCYSSAGALQPAALPPPLHARPLPCRRRGAASPASTTTACPALSPYTPGPEIWVGAAVPVAVFALGAWEFSKRILIQRRCAVCAGTGLVTMGGGGGGSPTSTSAPSSSPPRLVKCRACGGFFPWQSWDRFMSSAPGNGGPLQQPTLPRQSGIVYRVPSVEEAKRAAAQAGVKTGERGEGERGDEPGRE
jgi:hypothetical protein